jgi:DNA-binding MarR family transcriptional regulator
MQKIDLSEVRAAVHQGALPVHRFDVLQTIGRMDKLPGGWCWASQVQLGAYCNLSRQAVNAAVRILAQLGLLSKRTHQVGGAREKCSYRLTAAGRELLRRGMGWLMRRNPYRSSVSGGGDRIKGNIRKLVLFQSAANKARQLSLWITSKALSSERAAPLPTEDQLQREAQSRAEFIALARSRGMAL